MTVIYTCNMFVLFCACDVMNVLSVKKKCKFTKKKKKKKKKKNHCTDYMWLPNDESEAPKIPPGKGKRLIVLHACTRSED